MQYVGNLNTGLKEGSISTWQNFPKHALTGRIGVEGWGMASKTFSDRGVRRQRLFTLEKLGNLSFFGQAKMGGVMFC